MKIMNQQADHKKFGRGTVIGMKNNKIYVSFGKVFGDKVFPYPQVFKEDMRMVDEEQQEEIMDDI